MPTLGGRVLRLGDLPAGEVRVPDVAHLALADEVVENVQCLLDRASGGQGCAAGTGRSSPSADGRATFDGATDVAARRLAARGRVADRRRPEWPNFVASATWSRRPRSAFPMRVSESPTSLPYMSAVSRKVTPASIAASSTVRVPSRVSVLVPSRPKLLHPSPTAETRRPEAPTLRSGRADVMRPRYPATFATAWVPPVQPVRGRLGGGGGRGGGGSRGLRGGCGGRRRAARRGGA